MTFVANEGVLVSTPHSKLLIDALFGPGLQEYGAASISMRAALEDGQAPFDKIDLVLATHVHRDHFDPDAVLKHLSSNPRARFVSTTEAVTRLSTANSALVRSMKPRLRGVELGNGTRELVATTADVRVYALGMPHGPTSKPAANIGFLIEAGSCRMLHIGDTTIGSEEVAAFNLGEVNVALLPYWYLLTPELGAAVRQLLRPRVILILHTPAAGYESPYLRSRGGWQQVLQGLRAEFPMAHAFSAEGEVWPGKVAPSGEPQVVPLDGGSGC